MAKTTTASTDKKRSFIMYTEHAEFFKELTREQAGDLILAIMDYETTGEEPSLSGVVKMAFIAMRQDLDRNREKHDRVSELRRLAGEKGNRKRWQGIANDRKNRKCDDNDNENDNENENERDGAPASPSHPSFNSENRDSILPIEEKNYGKPSAPNGDSAAPPRNSNGNRPPSVEEVLAYTESRVSQGRPRINAEAFVNFYQSKGWMVGKNKMKDWKAAVHTWEQKSIEQGGAQKHNLKVSVPQMSKEDADRLRKRSEMMMKNIVSKNPHNGRK